ncbi:odorant-binding protein 2b-like [Thomomys bottae]
MMDVDLAMTAGQEGGLSATWAQAAGRGDKGHLVRGQSSLVHTAQETCLACEPGAQMKTLLLTAVLLGLVEALRAQDPLFSPPQELNVSLGQAENGGRERHGGWPSDIGLSPVSEITGTWYVKAMVAKNMSEERRPREVFPVTIKALEEGDLEAKVTFKFKGRCHEKKVVMRKTEEPGKYRDTKGHKVVYVEQLLTKDHIIVYCEVQRHGKAFSIGKLLGRTPEANPEALKEFTKFTQHKGLLQKNIIMPEQKGNCVPEQD